MTEVKREEEAPYVFIYERSMMNVVSVEPMVNMYPPSATYGKAFGIRLVFRNGTTKEFPGGMTRDALCEHLTKKQRAEVERLIQEIEG